MGAETKIEFCDGRFEEVVALPSPRNLPPDPDVVTVMPDGGLSPCPAWFVQQMACGLLKPSLSTPGSWWVFAHDAIAHPGDRIRRDPATDKLTVIKGGGP